MDLRTRIQSLFKEAEIYRQQGLYQEARQKYVAVAGFLQKNESITNRQQLLDAISKKIAAIENEINELDDVASPEQMAASNVQDLVKGFFSSSASKNKNKGAIAFKGAVALAQLRQFERALIEFTKLIPNESIRVSAAKNVIKCQMALSTLDKAVIQYDEWLVDEMFSDEQIESVRMFFEDMLKQKNRVINLKKRHSPDLSPAQDLDVTPASTALFKPSAAETDSLVKAAEAAAEEAIDEDPIDICSLEITMDSGPVEFDVTNQIGNKLTLTIPGDNKKFMDTLETGSKLEDLQFFSHFIMFRGAGVVLTKSQSPSGDYSLDIRMETQTGS